MAGQTVTLADNVLKDDYEGPVSDQMNQLCKLTAQVTKNRRDFYGRQAVIPCHVGRNTGFGARLEGEVLPAAGGQSWVRQLVPVRYQYGKIRLTKQVISRMASDRGGFLNMVNAEMDGIKTDGSRDYNRQLWGTSDGVVAKCGTTSGVNVVVLDTLTTEQMLVYFAENSMRVDIGTVAAPTLVAANRLVTSVDFTNKTITIDGPAVTTSNVNFVFRQGAGGSGAGQREVTGVQTIVSATGALFNIDPATTFQWASIVDANGGTARPISESLIAKSQMRANNRSGKDIDLLWCEDGVYRAFGNLLQGQKRIVNTQALQGGYSGLEFNSAGVSTIVTRDKDCPPGKMYGFCTPDLVEYVEDDWQWESMDGSVLNRATDGTHAFEAIWYSFREFATVRRNSHFRIDDLEVA